MEEEAEILMCLWVDKPGIGGGVGSTPSSPSCSQSSPQIPDVHATAVLQEVLPGVSVPLHTYIYRSRRVYTNVRW